MYQINAQITFYCSKSKETIRRSAFLPTRSLLCACVCLFVSFSLCVCACARVLVCQYKNKCFRSLFVVFFLSSNDYYDLIHPLAIRLQIRCLFDIETRDFGAFATIHLIISNVRNTHMYVCGEPQHK